MDYSVDVRKLFLENWGIKLVSLVLSLALWYNVTSKGKTEMTLTVPLELRNIPQGMAVVGDVIKNLDVRLQGQERVLRDITSGKKVVGILDLSTAKAGENLMSIGPGDISAPSGVAVTRISPSEINVALERLVRKSLPVRARLRGTPAEGYAVAGVSVTPSRITVEGPKSVMKTLTGLQTMPITISGASRNISLEPRIDYQGKPLNILEKNVTVRISIEKVTK